MCKLPFLWEMAPPDATEKIVPYGNVAGISDWPNWEVGERLLPARIFYGDIDFSEDDWRGVLKKLEQWEEFIWSDDSVPWVTFKGAETLVASGLTGFELQPILITEIGNLCLGDKLLSEQSILQRVVVSGEFDPEKHSSHSADFVMALMNGKRLAITKKTVDWLQKVGWNSFYLEPLSL